jgi:hypothetical protein
LGWVSGTSPKRLSRLRSEFGPTAESAVKRNKKRRAFRPPNGRLRKRPSLS